MMQYNVAIIVGTVLGLVINLLPSIIAFIKRSYNKITVLLLNIIPWFLSLITLAIASSLTIRNGEMSIIALVITAVISLINIALWIVALIKAIRS